MSAVFASLMLSLRQLADPAVLRILLRCAALTIIGFIALSWAGWFAFSWALEWAGLSDTLFSGASWLRDAAAALLAVLGLWLAWRLVAMAAIQFYADEIVKAVEASHYPQAASAARDLSLGQEAKKGAASILRTLGVNLLALPIAAVLLFTAIGPAIVFWTVNAILVGRELQDMVWLRHQPNPETLCPVSGWERFILGGVIAGLLVLPFVNLLAPVLGAAAATHLVHRKKEQN